MTKHNVATFINAALILILSGVLAGAFYVQFVLHEKPCPLCMLQRLGMIGIAIGALLNLRFGMLPAHYAVSILSAIMGGSVSLRHISLHICPSFPVTDPPFLGLHLFTWAFIVFASSLFTIAMGLFLYDPKEEVQVRHRFEGISKYAFYAIGFITLANVLTTFFQCGLGICE